MTGLHTLDQRLLDQQLTGGVAAGSSARVRYNTPVMTKFMASKAQPGQPLASRNARELKSAEYWDADLQSYMYLQDFIKTIPSWKEEL